MTKGGVYSYPDADRNAPVRNENQKRWGERNGFEMEIRSLRERRAS